MAAAGRGTPSRGDVRSPDRAATAARRALQLHAAGKLDAAVTARAASIGGWRAAGVFREVRRALEARLARLDGPAIDQDRWPSRREDIVQVEFQAGE